ncbi:MAG: hypothetical protein L6V93_18540 [Clostridiales bacterium]|nr:MAG: hypothetical protein L6V93_18540 [Clostridiales bacterium]
MKDTISGAPKKRYVAKFCKKYETPIAEIIIDILGALRSGFIRYFFRLKRPRELLR